MLRRSFSLASVVGLGGLVVFAGCSDDPSPAAGRDAGPSSTDSGADPQDSGSTTPDSGQAPGATITYGTCPAFTKCGGDLLGSWKVSGGCLSEDTFAAAKTQCPGLKETDVVITASGTVDVTATNVNRDVSISLTGKVAVPKTCLEGAPCAALGLGLTNPLLAPGGLAFKTATCTDGTDVCNCDVATTRDDKSDVGYTTTPDGTLTIPASGAAKEQTYDYCVAGSKLTYTETTATQTLKLFVEISK
jgi:hypothetical protein